MDRAFRRLEVDSRDLSRRKAVQVIGGATLAFLFADQLVGRWTAETYHSNGTELRLVGGQNLNSNLFAVSFGGEGNYEDYWGALSLYKASDRQIPTADMVYDNINGLNFQDMARVLKDAQRKRGFEYLVINGDSLGAMFGMYTALHAGIPVAGFIANSGPMKLGDARTGAIVAADLVTSSANPHDKLVETAELALKDLWCYFRDNPFGTAVANLPDELKTLPDQMSQGGSAELQRDQLMWAQQIDFNQLVPEFKRRGVIGDFTNAVFLRAWEDNVIDPSEAYWDWSHWLKRGFDIQMKLLQMPPGSKHADVFAEGTTLHGYGYFDYLINQFDPPILIPGDRTAGRAV
jgi:pimeloyl-ACP methyl ester carboxylesterase